MKSKLFPILFALTLASAIPSYATECSNELPLDQLPMGKITISLLSPFQIADEDFDPKYEVQTVRFSKGEYHHGTSAMFRNLFKRGVELNFLTETVRNKTVQPFECVIVGNTFGQVNISGNISFLTSPKTCTLSEFNESRASLDQRATSISLGSLKYNLGEHFRVSTDCN